MQLLTLLNLRLDIRYLPRGFAFDHFDLGATIGAGATLILGHSYAATLELRYNRTLLNHITSSDEDFAVFSDFTVLFGIHYDLPF